MGISINGLILLRIRIRLKTLSVCVSPSPQKSQETALENILLCGPLEGDTVQKVVAAFLHSSSQQNYVQRCTHKKVQMQR